MSEVILDLESTLFVSGIFTGCQDAGTNISADTVCSWLGEVYYKQREELAAEIQSLEEMIKGIEDGSIVDEIESEEGVEVADKMSDEERKEMADEMREDLEILKNKKPELTLIINSPGGEYDHLIQIYDFIQLLDADVRTIVNGSAFSAGAFLAISGTKGKRFITPRGRLMLHGVAIGLEGKTSELKVDYKEAERLNTQMTSLIMRHTGMTEVEACKYTDRDIYITPEEAVKLGMVDEIITKIV